MKKSNLNHFVPPSVLLSYDEMPARSRLYALAPIGLDTARTEGLLSYLIRLAAAHSVNPRRLIRTEFVAVQPDIAHLNHLSFFRNNARTVNGLGPYAQKICDAISALTGAADLRYSTLLPLQNLLPHICEGLLSRHPKWCPNCFAGMAKSGDEPYRPLIWSFLHYRCCSIHRQPLMERCPVCGKVQDFIPRYPSVCHCSHCGSWLGQGANRDLPSADDLGVSAAIEDIVLNLRSLEKTAALDNLLLAAEIAAQRNTSGKQRTFCRTIGIERSALGRWLAGHRPSIHRWLVLAYALDTQPSSLLLHPYRDIEPTTEGLRKAPDFLCVRRSKVALSEIQRKRIEDTLREIADDSNDHRSLSSIAKHFKWDAAGLRRLAPEPCNVIRDKYVLNRKLAGEQNHANHRETLLHIFDELVQGGEYPGGQRLKRMLSQKRMVLIPRYLKTAYFEALREWMRDKPPEKPQV